MKFFLHTVLLCLAAGLCAGCRHSNTPEVSAPEWKAEQQLLAETLWQVADDAQDITSRMYVTVSLGDTVGEGDRLAAFCQSECLCIAEPVMTDEGPRFYLVINRPKAVFTNGITLAFSSVRSGQVSYWPELFFFEHDGILGNTLEPLCPPAGDRCSAPFRMAICCSLPQHMVPAEGDEMAVFVGDRCRLTVNPLEKNGHNGYEYSFYLPMLLPEETIEMRYFERATGKIYVASGITARLGDVVLFIDPVPFK